MKIRDARAKADPRPEDVEAFEEDAQLAADYDGVSDAEPEPADEPEAEPEPVDEPEAEQADEELEADDDVEDEVPGEPELLDEDAVVLDGDEDTLPADPAPPEVAALHEVDDDELAAPASDEEPGPMFDGEGPLLAAAEAWRGRWDQVQLGFVDEPLDAVEAAGRVVAEVLDEVARTFAARRQQVEARWSEGGQITTDELRQVFLGYRAFFNRVIL
jgi:hypothetical protein